MNCAMCDLYDDYLNDDGVCADCEVSFGQAKRVYTNLMAARAARAKPKKVSLVVDGVCAHTPCTNILVPTGKRGRPSAYCSPECRKVAQAEYDAERMRAKRAVNRRDLNKVLTEYGPGFSIIDVTDKEPENGYDVGQTSIRTLTVIGSEKPWNKVA